MKSEFGFRRDVIVTPSMLNRYFFMTKTEILVHLFLLSVCDSSRHIKRNVRALARETKRWHADVYGAIIGLKLKKMLEEKRLKTKGGRYWRVYPLPRTRKENSKKQNSQPKFKEVEVVASNVIASPRSSATPDRDIGKSLALRSGVRTGGELKSSVAINQKTERAKKGKKGFLRRVLEKIRPALERSEGIGKS